MNDESMELFRELALCGDQIYTWCYDAEGKLLSSNCPEQTVLGAAFIQFDGQSRMLEHCRSEDCRRPMVIGTAIGMIWYAAFAYEGEELRRCWTLGPVFYKNIPLEVVYRGFQYYSDRLEFSPAWQIRLYRALREVPVVPTTLMQRYVLMLHYCLTGEHLSVSDIYLGVTGPEFAEPSRKLIDRHKVYMAERALLDMVRNGDLHYQEALNNSMNISSGVPVDGEDALRQGKTSAVVFTSLVCRAAIEGGLSPELAYSLGDSYIQAAENAHTIDELSSLCAGMYRDFIGRVHKLRDTPARSEPIRRCCDYIELNLEKKLRAEDLARLVGYSRYYLTQLFRREMGMSLNDYIKAAKVERAKVLLRGGDNTLAEIAEQLGFGTRSYFTQVFTQLAGMSPQAFRAQERTQ